MNEISLLGNSELFDCFQAVQIRVLHTFHIDGLTEEDYQNDPRQDFDDSYLPGFSFSDKEELYLKMLDEARKTDFGIYGLNNLSKSNKHDVALYMLLRQEIIKRGFDINDKNLFFKMRYTQTYIREIVATNYPGDNKIILSGTFMDMISFDYPVRQACRILTEKGYVTYWSSANIDDFKRRNGHAVKDKNVAYILIDPDNLTDELKKELLLDGDCNFWGIALRHSDNGKYYGIWAEITSIDMLCDDLSKALAEKALALPNLNKEKESSKK